jgi:hypothetical protein
MKKIILFVFPILFNSILSNGQGKNSMFLFGYDGPYRGTMNLISGAPIVTADSTRTDNLSFTHANISDKFGNLLFYTNGAVVLDGNHDTMPNGTGLNPCPYIGMCPYGLINYQGDIILPFPDDSNNFYLFHQALEYLSTGTSSQIYYSKIDMTMNSNKGDIMLKNISFFQDTLSGGMNTACRHANGRDWWLIVPKAFCPVYHIFLITPLGIQLKSTQTIGQRSDVGQAAFSLNGEQWGYFDYNLGLDIMDFDRCLGILSNVRHINVNDSVWGHGFCFSPDSRLAYATNNKNLYQFNLDSSNLSTSMQIVAQWDSSFCPNPPWMTGFDFMQIGPDNKIYMTTNATTFCMQYINYPDSIGLACDMKQHSIALPTFNDHTIPNFPNYFLGPVIGSVCDSLGLGITESIYDKNLNLNIRPNPATESFYLNYELPSGKDATMLVYDATGRKIYAQPLYSVNKSLQVHCNSWATGVYMVKVKMNKDSFEAHAKVVVTK